MKLGRLPRRFSPDVPHLSAWLAAKSLPPPPLSRNWMANMPDAFGMMLNDRLGCCTCSAVYHTRQVWTAVAQAHEVTDPDKDVLRTYEWAAGYDPKNPSTDQGAICQDILKYWLNHGVPVGKEMHWNHIIGFWEVDPRNVTDVKRGINDCGVVYIGFDVPSNIMPQGSQPPLIWEVQPGSTSIGGHCVALAAYDENYVTCISWGQRYHMTWDFFTTYCDEAYPVLGHEWFTNNGKTVLGMTEAEVESQMQAMRIKLAA